MADREGERVVCVGAGLEHPQLSGAQFTDIAHLGRTFGIGQCVNYIEALMPFGELSLGFPNLNCVSFHFHQNEQENNLLCYNNCG